MTKRTKKEPISVMVLELMMDLLRDARVNPYNFKEKLGQISNQLHDVEKDRLEWMFLKGRISVLKENKIEPHDQITFDNVYHEEYNV